MRRISDEDNVPFGQHRQGLGTTAKSPQFEIFRFSEAGVNDFRTLALVAACPTYSHTACKSG